MEKILLRELAWQKLTDEFTNTPKSANVLLFAKVEARRPISTT